MSDDLIERLEAATEGSRELDARIACYLSGDPLAFVEQSPFNAAWCVYKPCDRRGRRLLEKVKTLPFTTSIDAALTLVPDGDAATIYIGHDLNLATITGKSETPDKEPPDFIGEGTTPALAICIAALEAKGLTDTGEKPL